MPIDPKTAYPVRLGPLRFVCVAGDVTEPLGDRLEAVGAALVPGERSARAAQITLPVQGSYAETDHRAAGLALRRQVRALLENPAWKDHGLYYEAGWDPETAAWLKVGSGNLTDEQRGFAFGDWRLALEDAYLVGRPRTHRRGRRFTMADRASGTVATDTRGTLFTKDMAGVAAGGIGVYLPGDITLARGFGGRVLTAAGVTPVQIDGRLLYSAFVANDGETITYRPNAALLTSPREREASVEDVGDVNVWAMPGAPAFDAGTPTGDRAPDGTSGYGWERVLGQLAPQQNLLSVENGWVRCSWLGAIEGGGLQIERWRSTDDRYRPAGRLTFPPGASDPRVVEVTAERAVLAWTLTNGEARVILQRGWPGPRVEVYNDDTANATPTNRQPVIGVAAGVTSRNALTTWADRFQGDNTNLVIAKTSASTVYRTKAQVAGPTADSTESYANPAGVPLVLQVDAQQDVADADRAARTTLLARWDGRSIPVLVGS